MLDDIKTINEKKQSEIQPRNILSESTKIYRRCPDVLQERDIHQREIKTGHSRVCSHIRTHTHAFGYRKISAISTGISLDVQNNSTKSKPRKKDRFSRIDAICKSIGNQSENVDFPTTLIVNSNRRNANYYDHALIYYDYRVIDNLGMLMLKYR